MLWTLVQKELKNNLLSMRFILTLVVVLIVMLGSIQVRIDDYVQSTLDNRANSTAERQASNIHHFWGFQWEGMRLERPVMPLSVLVTGSEKSPDNRFRVFQKTRPLIRATGSIDRNPLQALSTPVDLMFITGIVMSLLVLVLSFDAVSGERELGTLKLLLSFPVPRAVFIFAKWVGGILTLSIPFLIGYLCLAIWIVLSGKVTFGSEQWFAYLLMGVASLLYIAWMFSAALLVSCWFRHPATSMCMLLFLWVVLVLIIPNVCPYIAAGIVPVDSAQSISFKGMKKIKKLQAAEQDELRALAKKYNVNRWWHSGEGWAEGIDIAARGHEEQAQITRTIVDKRDAQIEKQNGLAMALGRISPFTSYANIVTTLAWTGPGFERHLQRHMREYENHLRQLTTSSLHNDVSFSMDIIPYFHYRPPSLGQRFMDALMDWSLLIAGTVILFLGAYVSFVTREII